MSELKPGISREQSFDVTHAITAAAMFEAPDAPEVVAMPSVWSTPDMIGKMEMVSAAVVAGLLPAEQMTVGTRNEVSHLAATPEGSRVRVRSTLAAVNGRKLTFDVEAFDEHEKVGEGTHVRFIVDRDKFAGRLAEKRRT